MKAITQTPAELNMSDDLYGLSIDVCLTRAQACLNAGEGNQALRIVQAVVSVAPDNLAVLVALGVALRAVGRLDAAAEAFSRVLLVQPDRTDAQVYLGMIRLAQGRQDEGWPLYNTRWRYAGWTDKLRYPENTLWQGQVQAGMRLLLWGEQGFGDCIQFSRYAPWLLRLLRSHGGTLALEVPAPLRDLMRASWPFMDIFSSGETRGHFDVHLPLMDLPLRWGALVGSGGLPYQPLPIPYLSALPDLLQAQRGAVAPSQLISSHMLRVGIVWQGRHTHPDDRLRSIAVSQLDVLFSVQGVRWVSLQKDKGAAPAWLPDDMANCHDFADTARIVDGLDIVVCIDSAVAHLAAALGKPVWMLLAKVADWRWGLTGETTPWYSNMRLFRQGMNEDWPQVMARVVNALNIMVARSGVAV